MSAVMYDYPNAMTTFEYENTPQGRPVPAHNNKAYDDLALRRNDSHMYDEATTERCPATFPRSAANVTRNQSSPKAVNRASPKAKHSTKFLLLVLFGMLLFVSLLVVASGVVVYFLSNRQIPHPIGESSVDVDAGKEVTTMTALKTTTTKRGDVNTKASFPGAIGSIQHHLDQVEKVIEALKERDLALNQRMDALRQLLLTLNETFARDPMSWIPFENSYYWFANQPMTFQQAKSFCKSIYAKLLIIESKVENDIVKSVLQTIKRGSFMLGLTNIGTGSGYIWKWYNNDSLTFVDWHRTALVRRNEQYAIYEEDVSYQWDSVKKFNKYPPICEKNK